VKVKLNIDKVLRRRNTLQELGKDGCCQVKSTKAWTPPKNAGRNQRKISGQKNELFQF